MYFLLSLVNYNYIAYDSAVISTTPSCQTAPRQTLSAHQMCISGTMANCKQMLMQRIAEMAT